MGWINHANVFFNEYKKKIDLLKTDFSIQKNKKTGLFQKIKYQEKNIISILNNHVTEWWDEYYSKMDFAAIEQQMYGTKRGKKIYGDKKYVLMSRILYTILESRGITCFMVRQNDIREDLGTQLLAHEQTGNANKDRELRKKKSIQKLKEIVGNTLFIKLKKQFGKLDDVADAFLITFWAKMNLKKLIREKENTKFKWLKNKRIGKRINKISIDVDFN